MRVCDSCGRKMDEDKGIMEVYIVCGEARQKPNLDLCRECRGKLFNFVAENLMGYTKAINKEQ